MQKCYRIIGYCLLLAGLYFLLPLLFSSQNARFLLLLAWLPGLSFVCSWFYGLLSGFCWHSLYAPALLAVLPMLLYYNETALPFAAIYGVLSWLACFFGGLWHRKTGNCQTNGGKK